MRTFLAALAVSGLSFLSCAAHADTFNFSATALGATVNGTLTATNTGSNGAFLVTGISAAGVGSLIAPSDPFFGNDNFVIPSNVRAVDVNGLAFTETIGGQLYSLDIFSTQAGFQVLALNSSLTPIYDNATFSVSSPAAVTPEPSSLCLLGTGLLGMAAAVRRRFA